MADPDTKTCTKCGETKPLTDFPKNSKAKDGRRTDCKPCHAAYIRARYHANLEKSRAANRARMKNSYDANPEKYREIKRQNYASDPAKWVAVSVRWAKANPEKVKAYKRKWNRANPDLHADGVRRRRSRIAGRESDDYTRREIYDRHDGTCALCNLALAYEPGGFEIDHIVPISLGGPDTRANVQLACRSCNRKKAASLSGQLHFGV